MESLVESNELELFHTKIVKDFYDFNWNMFAKHIHYFGAFVHFFYFMLFVVYVNEVYVNRRYEHRVAMCWMMLGCIVVPIINDGLQMKNLRFEYVKDPWNYIDMSNIWIGLANILVQRFEPDILSIHS